jgi:hypothetical protein
MSQSDNMFFSEATHFDNVKGVAKLNLIVKVIDIYFR